ncbi:MAG: cupin domain-containing protein [Spirochaetes bacterium]|nr:cupin domain-containing protein [Spirochaetota bacterium]
MIIKKDSMRLEIKTNMRGGEGDIKLLHLAEGANLVNSRLLSYVTIAPGCSIGNHEHKNETEYYIILNGDGVVVDDGVEKSVGKGDLVITGGGASHSIRNSGGIDLELIAVIILEK